ncbi:hypothetical protein PAPYR_471 [Paratrimastix pyriformis]|uniref:Uncharacterized protein n=1 Tax=Paratrimastix pyriformis TaxID=342808 RepID=A0ABQ8UVB8_9EUKA|nr:hypothetical protein PAPYR_471 [Paratrimastix pyriformis]
MQAAQEVEVRELLCFGITFILVQFSKGPTGDLWERLPTELLRAIVEASSCPLHVYIQLLGLSRAIRAIIRGTLRELSFVLKLSFNASLVGEIDWADEAFGGHNQLAALIMPYPPQCELVVERILSHLPGLAELTLGPYFCVSTRLLQAMSRFCPGLQALRCSFREARVDPDFAALAPLAGVLEVLNIQETRSYVAALVGSLSAVTTLKLPQCPPAALVPIASHLTRLKLRDRLGREEDLPGPWLCRLEALSLAIKSIPPSYLAGLFRLLAANRATLRRLGLRLGGLGPEDVPPVMAALRALPHLTHLRLCLSSPEVLPPNLLPPDLLERLERLNLEVKDPLPIHIASRRLLRLRLTVSSAHISGVGLEVHCPALVELELPNLAGSGPVVLRCPRLRILKILRARNLDGATPMPDLEVVETSRGDVMSTVWKDPVWLLGEPSPRLRSLCSVRLTRPDLLASLCACGSLVRLKELYLDVTRLPNPLVLRLPGQLEHLDLGFEGAVEPSMPLDLHVEAPGLLDLSLESRVLDDGDEPLTSVRLCLNCPHLADVTIDAHDWLSLQVDSPAMQPRGLTVAGLLEPASLLGLLTRHGAWLREIQLYAFWAADEDWPELMEALSGLPRLAKLDLDLHHVSGELSLACPRLRVLVLRQPGWACRLTLACPLLEQLTGARHKVRPDLQVLTRK